METKTCSRCTHDKPLSEFGKHPKGGTQPYCLQCQRDASRLWYQNNKARQLGNARRNSAKAKQRYFDYKKKLKCEVCPESESVCLDFHHPDPGEKDFTISEAAMNGLSWKRIVAEINKCHVLCGNCHKKVHAGLISLPPRGSKG